MVLDAVLLNTQHYKVRISGEVEQRPPLHFGVVAFEKGAFGVILVYSRQLYLLMVTSFEEGKLWIQTF